MAAKQRAARMKSPPPTGVRGRPLDARAVQPNRAIPSEWTLPDIDGIQVHSTCQGSGTVEAPHGKAGRTGKICRPCRGQGVRKDPARLWSGRDEGGRQTCLACGGEGQLPKGDGTDDTEDCWACGGEGYNWP